MKLSPATNLALALTTTAARSDAYRAATDAEHKREWGQFFTSPQIATFMASLFRKPPRREVRLLDAGAGTGVLGLAAAETLIKAHGARVHLVAVEKEPGAVAALREMASEACHRVGAKSLSIEIRDDDFLDLDCPQLGSVPLPSFDYAIANPPYFKMSPDDERGGGAPNAYARFMEVSGRMLRADGELCFIIPRSFAAGFYFRQFRRRFHSAMRLDHVHLFESRRDAFRSDGVLQENIIVHYRKTRETNPTVGISCSAGERDLDDRFQHQVKRGRVLSDANPDSVLFLPSSARDLKVMSLFSGWHDSLASYGLDVSTGPVVPFRAEDFLRSAASQTTIPMLWLQHVLPGRVTWPLAGGFRKPEHIERDAPEKLLVPNRTYVLLRRFSAKEDARRLVAAPYLRDTIRASALGLENHLNFIHRRSGGEIEAGEAQAFSALLGSGLFDAYFRISNGNTQVSATELRALPLPPSAAMKRVAARIAKGIDGDEAVSEVLGEQR